MEDFHSSNMYRKPCRILQNKFLYNGIHIVHLLLELIRSYLQYLVQKCHFVSVVYNPLHHLSKNLQYLTKKSPLCAVFIKTEENRTKEIITNAGSATKDMIYSAGNAAKDKLTAGAASKNKNQNSAMKEKWAIQRAELEAKMDSYIAKINIYNKHSLNSLPKLK